MISGRTERIMEKYRNLLIVFGAMLGSMITAGLVSDYHKKQLQTSQWHVQRFQDHYWLLNHWLELKNEGKSTASYFEEMGYRHIAVYGMAELGNRLMEDLEDSPVQIDYGIDRDISCSIARIDEVYYPEDDLPETDVIVVTPYSMFEEIKELLEKKVRCPVVSLEEVVWSV